jgi:tetratricopeptide (TPR) repeat protein
MKETKSPSAKKSAKTLLGRPPVDTERKQAIEAYGAAMKLMQEGKYEKARAAFDKLLTNAPVDLAERAKLYRIACDRQLQDKGNKFATPEEQYDYAISLLNEGLYDDAREQFGAILKANGSSDYAHYGLAVVNSITGQTEASLEHLSESIRLNPQNRIHARGDSDFQDILDDPRFTELLYPEVS